MKQKTERNLPFAGLGFELEQLETGSLQVIMFSPKVEADFEIIPVWEGLSGYDLMTALGRETRGR